MQIISETMRPVSERLEYPEGYSDIALLHRSSHSCLYLARRAGKRFLLKTAASANGKDVEMLKREYELSIGLSHPSLAYVVTYEPESPVGACIVMEYVDGRTLDEFLKEEPSVEERKRVFLQLLDAVEYIHRSGIVHNDLSPANILVTRADNLVKLIDFGFADDDTHFLNKSLGGTRGYSSPELIAGETTDSRSDIWSLGALMRDCFGRRYAALAGRCMSDSPDRRPATVEAVRKAFTRRRATPFLIAIPLLLAVIAALVYFVQPAALASVAVEAELIELIDAKNCSWTWTEIGGVKGYVISGTRPGYQDKSIFIPASGYEYCGRRKNFGIKFRLPSSSISPVSPSSVLGMYASREIRNFNEYPRYMSTPIRPVKDRPGAGRIPSAYSEAQFRLDREDGQWEAGAAAIILPGAENAGAAPSRIACSNGLFNGRVKEYPSYVAVSPYYDFFITSDYGRKDSRCSPSVDSNGVVRLYIPAVREQHPGECASSADFYVGRSEGKVIAMKRLQGALRFSITSSDIERIELISKDGRKLSGMADIAFSSGIPHILSWDPVNSVAFVKLSPSSGKCFQPGEYLVSVPPENYEQGFRLLLVKGDEEAEVILHPSIVGRNAVVNYGVADAENLIWRKFLNLSFRNFPREGEGQKFVSDISGNRIWPFVNIPEETFPISKSQVEQAHPNERVDLVMSDGYTVVAFGEKGMFALNYIWGFRLVGTAYLEFPPKDGLSVSEIAVTVGGRRAALSVKGVDGSPVSNPVKDLFSPWQERVLKVFGVPGEPVRLSGTNMNLIRVKVYFSRR